MDALGAGAQAGPGIFVTDVNTHVTVVNSWNSYGGLGLVTHLVGIVFLIALAPARFHMFSHPLDAFYKAEMCWQHGLAWFLGCALYAIAGPLLVDDMLNQSSQNTTALYVSLFLLVYLASLVWWLVSMHFMIWRRGITRSFLVLAAFSVTLLVVWCFLLINDTHPAHTVIVFFMYLPIGLAWFSTDHCYGFRDRVCNKGPDTPAQIDCQPTDVWNREAPLVVHHTQKEQPHHHHHHHVDAQTKTHTVAFKDEFLNQGGSHDSWMDFLSDE